jgi:hypothetical protein
MGMEFTNEEFKQGEDQRLKYAYFEVDLEYISVNRERFENIKNYFEKGHKGRNNFTDSEVACDFK